MDRPKKQRADQALADRGLAESREKARALIMAGVVYRGEEKILKPSEAVAAGEALVVRGAPHPYVSRGGLKLEKAIRVFGVDPAGQVCMDLGASTGGFTDVLLRAGAKRVYAIDVGFGQLDWRIRSDDRVVVMERTNARAIERAMFDPPPTLAVMDVSFISIALILPAALRCMGGGRLISLIKPQFEAGRERVGKKGVVSDPAIHRDVLRAVVDGAPAAGWIVAGLDFSPIAGPEGNIEFLADLRPAPEGGASPTDGEIAELVRRAHEELRGGRRD
ncbi:MAG: TlyA family RNA methyltransferase [Clostridiales bacterium]|nr:TlyA family RNA methyltransferase [Clostridiales bacterium]